MKKFILSVVAIVCATFMANAQRTVDIATTLTNPVGASNLRAGTTFNADFTVTNLGPDTVKAGDTLVFFLVLGTTIQTGTQVNYVMTQPLLKDSSISRSVPINGGVTGGQSGQLNICALVVLINRTGVDTVRDNNAGGNNISCATVNYSVGIKEILGDQNNVKMYPNPVATEGTVSYNLTTACEVSVKVMDLTGRVIATAFEGTQDAGEQNVKVNTENIANGVYLYQININGESYTQKFIVNK